MSDGRDSRVERGESGPAPRRQPAARPATGGGQARATDALSLVSATFLGREREWIDPATGEIGTPPVAVGFIEYADGGGELFGVVTGKGGPGKGEAEVREYRKRRADERAFGFEMAERLADERAEERAKRSADEAARRARTKVRRMCRRYGLDHMVTLTFPGGGVQEYDRALRLVQDFIHDHGDKLHHGQEWLAVPELHPGGHGWHWHILVPRRFLRVELAMLREGWTDYLRRHGMEPTGGATYTRIDVKAFPNARAAVRYAAKYVGKAFDGYERQKGRRRYLNARGMSVEVLRGGGQSLQTVRWVAEQTGADYIVDSSELEEWHGPPMVFASWED